MRSIHLLNSAILTCSFFGCSRKVDENFELGKASFVRIGVLDDKTINDHMNNEEKLHEKLNIHGKVRTDVESSKKVEVELTLELPGSLPLPDSIAIRLTGPDGKIYDSVHPKPRQVSGNIYRFHQATLDPRRPGRYDVVAVYQYTYLFRGEDSKRKSKVDQKTTKLSEVTCK